MAENAFRVKPPVTNTIITPVVATNVAQIGSDEDEIANMLVIPVSREIASDFSLIGYTSTIRRIEEILTQRGKQRNVLLYGDNGVGKTAIIHGLVQRKNKNDLSTHMYKRMFYRLNTSRLLHTDDVSEINKQFDQAIHEMGHYDVLVIENFYQLVTYLRMKGANFLLISLLEALSRRKLQSIITCTTRERTLVINEVPEIHEYFAPEKLSEPNNDELLNVLLGVHRSYEARYSISITHDALCTIRDLTQKYRTGMEGWAQPGRAFILLDRAIAQFSVTMNSKPVELTELEDKAAAFRNEIESLTVNDGFALQEDLDRKDMLSTKLAELEPRIAELRQPWDETTAPIRKLQADKGAIERKYTDYRRQRQALADIRNDNAALLAKNTDATTVSTEIASLDKMIALTEKEIDRIDTELGKINLSELRDNKVTSDHIAQTFSELSGISAKQLTENERERVLNMENILAERVFGQQEAIRSLATAVRRANANLSDDEGTPKGSYLFLGPSGVGKTELGKALAEFLTGTEKNLIRFDMSEYMEQHAVSRLIGAPPGYAGHDEGGALTNAVHDHPKSVVMFDEIEKAHPDIFKVLLQVLGDGRLTDGRGVTVDFKETYIILTSNAGTAHFLDEELTYEQSVVLAMKDVDKLLLPEIRGRLDSIICFHRLDLLRLEKVAKRRIDKINKSIEGRKLKLVMADDGEEGDIHRFCAAYQDSRYGARTILKSLKKTLEDELATAILSSSGGGTLRATFNEDRTFTVEPEGKQ